MKNNGRKQNKTYSQKQPVQHKVRVLYRFIRRELETTIPTLLSKDYFRLYWTSVIRFHLVMGSPNNCGSS